MDSKLQQSTLTVERVHALLKYDKRTGEFTWRVNRRGTVKAGHSAGSLMEDGYIRIQIDGRQYPAHCLAWFYVHGRWPTIEIDHKDNVRHHNRWRNLREATVAMNRQNLKAAIATNKHSGLLGAHWSADHHPRPWRASIVVQKKRRHIGYFKTAKAAHAAYVFAKRQLHEGNTL